MSDSLSIKIGADIADLQDGLERAKDAILELANAFQGLQDFSSRADVSNAAGVQEETSHAAEAARRLADEIAQSDEQLALKQIAAAQQANNFELQMGEESLAQWKQKAQEEADAKLNAELAFLNRKLAADQGNALAFQKDLDQIAAAYQEHDNLLAQIDQQYAQKKRQQDQTGLQDFIKTKEDEVTRSIAAEDAKAKAHQISQLQAHDADIAELSSVEAAVLAEFDAVNAGLQKGTEAYDKAMKDRAALVDWFTQRAGQANNQLVEQEQQKWTTLGNSIKSGFNAAIDGMLFEGRSFGQGMLTIAQGVIKAFLTMGENIAENWIETQLTAMFTTKATQGTAALGQISDAAGVAGANAFAATAAIPVIGPALAPAAGAAAASEALSFSSLLSLAVGAWELKNDTLAQLHRGEMVVPQNFAEGMRGGRGIGGGSGDINMHYGPTINAREPATLSQMLTRESSEMLGWLNRQFRNGALRA